MKVVVGGVIVIVCIYNKTPIVIQQVNKKLQLNGITVIHQIHAPGINSISLLPALTPAVEDAPQAIAADKSDLLNSLVWTLLDQDDATSTDLVHPSHVHHTANLATLAELEDQQAPLVECQPQEAATETLEQDRKALFPFLTADSFDLSTDIENFEFWQDGFLANELQDCHCQQV